MNAHLSSEDANRIPVEQEEWTPRCVGAPVRTSRFGRGNDWLRQQPRAYQRPTPRGDSHVCVIPITSATDVGWYMAGYRSSVGGQSRDYPRAVC